MRRRCRPTYARAALESSADFPAAAFEFQRYREGGPLAVPDPKIAVRTDGQAIELSASIEVEAAKLRVALCVVIEERDEALSGALSYWALRHPAPYPDFHHPDGFVLEIA